MYLNTTQISTLPFTTCPVIPYRIGSYIQPHRARSPPNLSGAMYQVRRPTQLLYRSYVRTLVSRITEKVLRNEPIRYEAFDARTGKPFHFKVPGWRPCPICHSPGGGIRSSRGPSWDRPSLGGHHRLVPIHGLCYSSGLSCGQQLPNLQRSYWSHLHGQLCRHYRPQTKNWEYWLGTPSLGHDGLDGEGFVLEQVWVPRAY